MRLARRYDCSSPKGEPSVEGIPLSGCPTTPATLRAAERVVDIVRGAQIPEVEMVQIIHDDRGIAVTVYVADTDRNDEPPDDDPENIVIYEWVRGRELD